MPLSGKQLQQTARSTAKSLHPRPPSGRTHSRFPRKPPLQTPICDHSVGVGRVGRRIVIVRRSARKHGVADDDILQYAVDGTLCRRPRRRHLSAPCNLRRGQPAPRSVTPARRSPSGLTRLRSPRKPPQQIRI